MKRVQGYWVTPFNLTDKQRQSLLRCWKRRNDIDNAMSFLDAADGILERWLSIKEKEPSIAKSKLKRQATRINKTAIELTEAFDELHEMTGLFLKAQIDTLLYVTKYQMQYGLVAHDLGVLSHRGGVGGYEFMETMKHWLGLLVEASSKVASIQPGSGPNKSKEKWLV